MIRADKKDKELIVEILATSFNDNKTVNYIIKQDRKREQRLRSLMGYSFDVCYAFGEVFLSDDKKGCVLILFPDKKKLTLPSVAWDIKLVKNCVGVANLGKVLQREKKIKALHPNKPLYYLWFIGVDPAAQHKGTGSKLLQEVVRQSHSLGRTVCLETSTEKNIPWYRKHGFHLYNELDLGYRLYFFKHE